jgi:hypothetical protein
MSSQLFDLLNRGTVGAVIVFLSMSMFDRTTSQAAIARNPGLRGLEASLAPPKRGPAPSMIGIPMSFEGDDAGQYPTEAWRTYMNRILTGLGYDPIDGCAERTRTDAFVYTLDCSGEMVFVSGIYKATASMIPSKSNKIDVRTGSGLPVKDIVSSASTDIVDRSLAERTPFNQGYATSASIEPARSALPTSANSYVDESVPILNAPVPQTRRRGSRGSAD